MSKKKALNLRVTNVMLYNLGLCVRWINEKKKLVALEFAQTDKEDKKIMKGLGFVETDKECVFKLEKGSLVVHRFTVPDVCEEV